MSDSADRTGRAVVTAALRAAGAAVLLTTFFYRVPIDGVGKIGTVVGLAVALSIFGFGLFLEIRAIGRSRHPVARAAEALATLLPLLLLLFATLYVAIETQTAGSFSEPFNRTGAIYFTVTTFATVGFGDITPVSDLARLAVMTQMIVDLAVLGAVGRLVFSAATRTRERRAADDVDPLDSPGPVDRLPRTEDR